MKVVKNDIEENWVNLDVMDVTEASAVKKQKIQMKDALRLLV